MFEVDQAMMTAITPIAREQYIRQQVKIFEGVYPKRFACAGEKKVTEFFTLALHKAEQYNMLADREVNGLALLMQYLGCDFDIDPQYPWARFKRFPDKNFHDPEPESFVHLQKVYAEFLEFHQLANGNDFEHVISAYKRLRSIHLQDILTLRSDTDILNLLSDTFPQRYACIPANAFDSLLLTAHEKAIQYDLDPHVGKAIFSALLFSCGIGVDKDPLYITLSKNLVTDKAAEMSKEQRLVNQLKALVVINLRELVPSEQEEDYA